MKRCAELRPPGFDSLPAAFRELGPHYRARDPEGVERWRAIARSNPIDPATQHSARQETLNRITLSMLEVLHVPVLLISGEADLYAPPHLMDALALHLRDVSKAAIGGAGHCAHWECPQEFNKHLLQFLNAHHRS